MKITLLGSVGNINQHVIPALVKAGHAVTVITHSDKRVDQIKNLGAIPAVGSMDDEVFLTNQFTGADVVYLMLSGMNSDPLTAAKTQGQVFYHAVRDAGVQNVVDLSSVGADQPYELVGTLSFYHYIETALGQLSDVNITFVRPVGFYSNLFSSIPTIKQQKQLVSTVPANAIREFVSPSDIAATVTALLLNTPNGHNVRYVVSDEATGQELLMALQKELNMPDLKYVTITDEQFETALIKQGMPASVAKGFTIMTKSQRTPEKAYADLKAHQPVFGKVKLADFAKTFAAVYRGETEGHANTLADK